MINLKTRVIILSGEYKDKPGVLVSYYTISVDGVTSEVKYEVRTPDGHIVSLRENEFKLEAPDAK
jgi:hypothetical protein